MFPCSVLYAGLVYTGCVGPCGYSMGIASTQPLSTSTDDWWREMTFRSWMTLNT